VKGKDIERTACFGDGWWDEWGKENGEGKRYNKAKKQFTPLITQKDGNSQ